MEIINVCKDLLTKAWDINNLLMYFDNKLLDDIYFGPKKVDRNIIKEKIKDKEYLDKVTNTLNSFDSSIDDLVRERLNYFVKDTNYDLSNEKLFLIIGCDTTTIYSIKYVDEEVTVLLLEATNGDKNKLDLLLAHEFTHFIRRRLLNKDIFEECIGERFVTEGIASNYSREIVPNKKDEDYCLVGVETVNWVKENINYLDRMVKDKLNSSDLMKCFFYMYADIDIPVRVGYVYGYWKVREFLDRNNLKIKDILDIDWKEILNNI